VPGDSLDEVRFGDDDAVLDDEVQVDMLTIGASNVTGFVGVGGPYWTDVDGDGVDDTADNSRLYTQPEDVNMAYDRLSPIAFTWRIISSWRASGEAPSA